MKIVKVIHVLTDKNIGGAGRWLLYFLKCYNRNKFKIKVVIPEDSQLIECLEEVGADIIKVHNMEEKSYSKNDIDKFKRIFKQENPDIVHTHASLSARIAAKKSKVPYVINTKHCLEGSSRNILKKKLRSYVNNKYSNKIIAVSNAVKESLIQNDVSECQIAMIYNGIIKPTKASAGIIKAQKLVYGIEQDDKVVGIVARLEDVKNVDMFIKAAHRIVSKGFENVKFVIVGSGSLEERLKSLVVRMRLVDKVIFTGFVREVENIMSIFDINVITSKQEALCISVIEGMSMGIPAIGTDSGGVDEVIEDGVNGNLVRVNDYESLANRIEDLMNDPKRYWVYSKNAIETVNKKFLASEMTQKVEKLYLNAMRDMFMD